MLFAVVATDVDIGNCVKNALGDLGFASLQGYVVIRELHCILEPFAFRDCNFPHLSLGSLDQLMIGVALLDLAPGTSQHFYNDLHLCQGIVVSMLEHFLRIEAISVEQNQGG